MKLRPWLACSLPVLALGCTTYEYFDLPDAGTTAAASPDAAAGFADAGAPSPCAPGQWCSVDPALTPADLVGGWASTDEALTWALSDLGSIYRYDGAKWSTSYVPDREVTGTGVWAASDDDAWVSVIDGHAEIGAPTTSRFAHWDGTRWTMGQASYPLFVRVVWGSAKDDYWAAGYSGSGSKAAPAIVHYDGTTWSSVPLPEFPGQTSPEADTEIVDLNGTSRSDAWAMSRAGGVAHWDGTSWTLADLGPATPAPADVVGALGIWANSADDVWYARRRAPSIMGVQAIEFVHYDGSRWGAPVQAEGQDGCVNLGVGTTYAPGAAGTLGRGIAGQQGAIILADPEDSCAWSFTDGIWEAELFGPNGGPFRTYALGNEGDSFGFGAEGTVGPLSASGLSTAATEPSGTQMFFLTNTDVSATTANDVWALSPDPALTVPIVPGTGSVPGVASILHWDGTRLTTMTPLGGVGAFSGLAAVSPSNVWAVGCRMTQDPNDPSKAPGTVAVHYDGSGWSELHVASTGTPCVDATLDDVWASGDDAFAAGGALVVHWDGAAWRTLPLPESAGVDLTYVAGTSPIDVYFAGTIGSAMGSAIGQPYVLHWNGQSLSPITVPSDGVGGNPLAVFADAPNSFWMAANWAETSSPYEGVLDHWDGTAWTVTPMPQGIYPSTITGKSGQLYVAGVLPASYEEDIEGTPIDAGALFLFDGHAWTQEPLYADITGITSASAKDGALWVAGYGGLFAQETIGTTATH